jgi:serine protease SohB
MIWLWIVAGIVGLFLLVGILKKRKKKKACIRQSGQKHDAGFLKYHSHTKVEVKKSLHKLESKKEDHKSIAVLTFKGDMRASQNAAFSHVIDEVCLNKDSFSEVVVLVDSPGGSVTDYGQSYSLMQRLRDAGLSLTVCVDTVAASGGYLMSLPAHKIVAAPFAMVGSIGVLSFVPNIRKLLEKYNIEPRTFTAGEFKRTVTLTDNATPEQVKRYEDQLTLIHNQFKAVIAKYRPSVDLSKAATGEAWLAQATMDLNLGLVDELCSSSEYLLKRNENADLVFFEEKKARKGLARFLGEQAIDRAASRLSSALHTPLL